MAGDVALRCGLARLVAFCADRGIAPGAVDDAALEGFRAWLEAGTLVPDPGRVQRRACLEWNRAAGLVPGWPGRAVAVPDRRDRLGLPPGTFPASFLADVDAWQARLAGEDLFDEAGPAKPLRPATLRHTRHQVLAAASACVRAGCDPGELRSLADLVEPERLRRGLGFLLERYGGESTAALGELAATLVNVARHWVRLDPGGSGSSSGCAPGCAGGCAA